MYHFLVDVVGVDIDQQNVTDQNTADLSAAGADEPDHIFNDDLLNDCTNEPSAKDRDDAPVSGVVRNYLIGIKERLSKELKDHGMPLCYKEGHFSSRSLFCNVQSCTIT